MITQLKISGVRLLVLMTLLSTLSCSTMRGRVLLGGAVGGGFGALGGAALSPDEDNKPINALVFGLSGAVVGLVISALFFQPSEVSQSNYNLESEINRKLYLNPDRKESLPSFVKERISETVVEEEMRKDFVSEDGTLHEPHKVYRILRPSNLYAKPEEKGDAK